MAMRCEERGISYIKSSRLYEHVRKEHAKYVSKLAKARIGKKNGAYGSMWISNIDLKENAKIKRGDPIPDGWIAGKNVWNKKHRLTKEEFKEFRSKYMTNQMRIKRLENHDENLKISKMINDAFSKSDYTSFSKFAKESHKKFDMSYGSMYKFKNYK